MIPTPLRGLAAGAARRGRRRRGGAVGTSQLGPLTGATGSSAGWADSVPGCRGVVAVLVGLAGVLNIVSAVTPGMAGRVHELRAFLPGGVTSTATRSRERIAATTATAARPRPITRAVHPGWHSTRSGRPGARAVGSRQATHVIGTAALPADPLTLGVVHSRARQPIATLLVTLSALLLIAGVVGVWSSRTALDTPRWVATVTPLANDADVDAALAQYLTDQFQQIRLLMRFSGLAGQPVVQDSIAEVLRSPRFRDIWIAANQQAHAEFVAMLEGSSTALTQQDNGTVTLNLLPVVNNVLVALSDKFGGVLGLHLDLPPVPTNGQLPPGLRDRLAQALGVTLPPSFGQIRVLRSSQLAQMQDALPVLKDTVWGLVCAAVVLFAFGLLVAARRLRTLAIFGLVLAIASVALIITGSVVVPHYLGRIPDPVYRRGVSTAMSTVLGGLRTQGFVAAVAGTLLAVAGFTGATLARRQPVAAPTWRPTGAPVAGPELSQPTRILDAPPYQSEPLYRPEQQYQPERQ